METNDQVNTDENLNNSNNSQETTKEFPLSFIPEEYREESWATKYKDENSFYKGISEMSKMVGRKSDGIQIPTADSTEEEWNNFYSQAGRPETIEGYDFKHGIENVKFDLQDTEKTIKEISHKFGLNNNQANGIFNEYVNIINSQISEPKSLADVTVDLWGNDSENEILATNRGFNYLGDEIKNEVGDNLSNPIVLKIVNKLGHMLGEDTLVSQDAGGSAKTEQEWRQEARKLQASPKYMSGDMETIRQVEEIYKRINS